MAAIISANINLFFAFVPPILWLLFYLREDRHPEPKLLLLLTFIGGVASAFLAMAAELLVLGRGGFLTGTGFIKSAFLFFVVIALIEEYVKYLPVKFLVLSRCKNHACDFDEPVDGMIYMMTSALGFAAIENALFAFPFFFSFVKETLVTLPLSQENLQLALDVTTNRFLGANLLHALSSGLVGFFLARAWFSQKRHHFIALGIGIAVLLHALFNYLILNKEVVPQGTFYIILLLAMMAVVVFIDFERLKKINLLPQSPKTNKETS